MAERIKNNVKIQIFCMTVWIYLVHIPATTGKKQVDFFFSKLAHIEVDAIIFSQFERERKLSVIISETLQVNMFSVCLL